MKVVEQSVRAIEMIHVAKAYQVIEEAGRTAWKSEGANPYLDAKKTEAFVRMIIRKGHESVLEHVSVTLKLITSRTVTHALVRHRIAAYTQESTQYCTYKDQVTFAEPCEAIKANPAAMQAWHAAMEQAEQAYFYILGSTKRPQDARTVLPGSVKTTITVTMNIRQWRHVMRLRAVAEDDADETKEIMRKALWLLKRNLPVLFEDLHMKEEGT